MNLGLNGIHMHTNSSHCTVDEQPNTNMQAMGMIHIDLGIKPHIKTDHVSYLRVASKYTKIQLPKPPIINQQHFNSTRLFNSILCISNECYF